MDIATFLAERGAQAALAKALSVSPAFVNQWRSGSRPVPLEYCSAIERSTSGAVTRQDLRPNDYHLIWPELAAVKGAAPATTADAAEQGA